MTTVVDSKPYVEPDALIGYRYIPGTRMSLARPGGGQYELAINRDGIRGDRDYARSKPPGVTRIIVLGDSMAAGQFVSNQQRFSELLERRHPQLEVINLALEGSGTDQQVLLYEHVGLQYEHDQVLLLPFLQNIRRNLAGAREAIDPVTGAVVLRPKPRFELNGGELIFRPASETAAVVDEPRTNALQMKGAISRLPGAAFFKRIAYSVLPWEPFPEYRDPQSAGWLLMAALIARLKSLAGPRPLVVAPVFYSNYVRYRMALNYRERFGSLSAIAGIHPVDLLPHFQSLGGDAVRCFQDPYDMHFSADGHLVLADAIERELAQRGLLSMP
jgi:lysophospholipase L1-like esterase